MSAFWEALFIVGASTVVSLLGLFLVRRKISRDALLACHEVGGYLLAVVGTLYAILLGLVVVDSQNKLDQAKQMSIVEANMLSNIYHLSRSFKQPTKQEIRDSLYDYALAVKSQDWEHVEDGEEREATIASYRRLWRSVTSYEPVSNNEQQCFSTILGNLEQLSDARRFRMVSSRCGLSPVLWTVLLVGGVMVILFTYFFFVESLFSQALMTAFVVIFLALNIYLVFICQNPYRPELSAKDAGFGIGFKAEWFLDKKDHPDKD